MTNRQRRDAGLAYTSEDTVFEEPLEFSDDSVYPMEQVVRDAIDREMDETNGQACHALYPTLRRL